LNHHNASFSVLRVVHRTVSTWMRNLISFTLLSAIVHVPLILVILMGSGGSFGPLRRQGILYGVLVGISAMLVHAGIAHGIAQQLVGVRARVTESLVMVIERAVPLITIGLVSSLFSHITGSLPMALGIFVILSFLVVYTIYAVTIPVLMIEQAGIIKSLAGSQELTRGYRFHIVGVWLLLGVLNIIVMFAVPGLSGGGDTASFYRLLPLLSFLLLTPLHAAGSMAIYQELRMVQDGVDLASKRDFPQAQARVKSRAE
jgi:hypothetical protein